MRIWQPVTHSAPLFRAVGINTVPVAGVLVGSWGAPTAVTIYLIETFVLLALIALRIAWAGPTAFVTARGDTQSRTEFIRGFLTLGVAFSVGAGVFNAFFVWKIFDGAITWRGVGISLLVLLVLEGMALLGDRVLRRQADQRIAELWALRGLRRVFVLYTGIWFGFMALLWGPQWFLAPFMALKILMDIGVALEQAHAAITGKPVMPPQITPQMRRR
jgi:hypothetical protein